MHMNISYINMCKLKKNREWRKELEKERERLVVSDPSCRCGANREDSYHFFFDCSHYANMRYTCDGVKLFHWRIVEGINESPVIDSLQHGPHQKQGWIQVFAKGGQLLPLISFTAMEPFVLCIPIKWHLFIWYIGYKLLDIFINSVEWVLIQSIN
jgi:hypothetical protein